MSEIILPKYLNIGAGKISSIIEILKKINCKYPLIITDKTMVKLNILKFLSAKTLETVVLPEPIPPVNPTFNIRIILLE